MLEATLTGAMDEAMVEELTKTMQRFRGKLVKVAILEVGESERRQGRKA